MHKFKLNFFATINRLPEQALAGALAPEGKKTVLEWIEMGAPE